MKYHVLYNDRSGMFGEWYKEGKEWKFCKRIDVDMSELDMEYLLEELRKIKKATKQK